METCLWRGKQICAFDAKNEYGEWDWPIKEAFMEAGQARELTCESCGALVHYRPGVVKEPHFAHYSNSARTCATDAVRETQEHLAGKRILYHYFRRQYPTCSVRLNYVHEFGRRSDLFLEFEQGHSLAVEYQCQDLQVSEWREKQKDYKANGIGALWVLSSERYHVAARGLQFFAELIYNRGGTGALVMLDTNTSMFGMIREICIKDDDGIVLKRQLFDRRYHLSDVMILPDGEIVQSAFDKEYAQTLVVLQQQVDEERGKMVRRSAQSRLGMPAAQRKSGASVQDLRQVTLGAQSLRPEPAPRRFDAKGARCRQCGDYALEWTVYYGVDSTCLCKKCLH